MKTGFRKALALCGIIQPVLFTLFVVVESLLRPGYSQVTGYVSDLGAGSNGILQDTNFWITGILLIGLSVGLRAELTRAAWSAKVGPGLLAFTGVNALLVGVFVTDLPGAPVTAHGTLHNLFSIVAFFSLTASVWVTRAAQKGDPSWGSFHQVSLGFGIAAIISLAMLFTIATPNIAGLVQRILIAVLFTWVGITGVKLFQLPPGTPRTRQKSSDRSGAISE